MCKGSPGKREKAFLLCGRTGVLHSTKHSETPHAPGGRIATQAAFPLRRDTRQCAWRSDRALPGAAAVPRKADIRESRLGLQFTSARLPAALTASEDTGAPRGGRTVPPTTCGLEEAGQPPRVSEGKKGGYQRTVSYTNHNSTTGSRGALSPVPRKGIT